MSIDYANLWQALFSTQHSVEEVLIFDLRLPRALAAFACGGLLALAGLLMQVLIRNPLADPYVLGISGGASSFAIIAMIMGLSGLMINSVAFIGALLSSYLLFLFAKDEYGINISRLLLSGIVMASGWGALISFLLIVSPIEKIQGILFWLMGDLNYDSPLLPAYLILSLGFIITMSFASQLNIMVWGNIHAQSLGVNSKKIHVLLFITASALTAIAVTTAGAIGFVGLVTPHLMRLVMGTDHRILIPACLLGGGSLLVFADTLARTIFSPQQLPVGILTATLGVPVFLYLLHKNK